MGVYSMIPASSTGSTLRASASNWQPHSNNYSFRTVQGYQSHEESTSSTDSTITIVPSHRSEHDGYNRFKTPSGRVAMTAGGQTIELFAGTHQGARKDALGAEVLLCCEPTQYKTEHDRFM